MHVKTGGGDFKSSQSLANYLLCYSNDNVLSSLNLFEIAPHFKRF